MESIGKKFGQKSDDNMRVNSKIIRLMNEARIVFKQEYTSNLNRSFNA